MSTPTVELMVSMNHSGTWWEYGLTDHDDGTGRLRVVTRIQGIRKTWESDPGAIGTRDGLVRRIADLIRRTPEAGAKIVEGKMGERIYVAIAELNRLEKEGHSERQKEREQETAVQAAHKKQRDDLIAAGKGIRFKRQIITVPTDQGRTIDVEAHVHGGLAFHRPLSYRPHRDPSTWVITHVATGLILVKGIQEQALARGAVAALLQAGDWDRPVEELASDSDLKRAVVALKKFCHGSKQLDA